MLYPTISNYRNSRNQNHAIAEYDRILNEMDSIDYNRLKQSAKEYNKKLAKINSPIDNYELVSGYENTLDITGTGIMGYLTIPKINVTLPIYHGTNDEVLNVAIGHIQGTSLPVGGKNTHAVVSAHRGLPSAKLFSDLDQMDIGDTFTVTVLNEILTYSVCKISTVTPDQLDQLEIEDNKDLMTLVTCTPYGINSHRLLIKGTRIETTEQASVRVSSDAIQIEPMIVAPIIAMPILIALFTAIIIDSFIKKSRRKGR